MGDACLSLTLVTHAYGAVILGKQTAGHGKRYMFGLFLKQIIIAVSNKNKMGMMIKYDTFFTTNTNGKKLKLKLKY